MFCHVVAKRPAPLCSPLGCNTEAALPTGGVSYGCRENDHKPSCFRQHRLTSFGFWGSGVSSGSRGFSPLGDPGNSLFPHLVQLLGPGGPHRSNISLGGRISTSDPPASDFHLEHPWGDVGPIASSPHLRVLHHIRKIPFALEGDTFTGPRAGAVTSFTGHYSASHNYYLGPS